MDASTAGRLIIIVGIILILLGGLLILRGKLPFLGRLPGDIHVQRRGFSVHLPIVTCLLLSIFLTIVINLFIKRR